MIAKHSCITVFLLGLCEVATTYKVAHILRQASNLSRFISSSTMEFKIMNNSKFIESMVGLFVLFGFVGAFYLAMDVSNLSHKNSEDGYKITARFENVGGLQTQAKITMAGVKLGHVVAIKIDQETYEAVVTMQINSQFNKLPDDTSASIFTSGLLGNQYIALLPGASNKILSEGEEIQLTQSAVILEEVIGQFLYNKSDEFSDTTKKF